MPDTDHIRELVRFAVRFARLGDAIGEQVAQVLKDPHTGADINWRAIEIGAEMLRGVDEDIDITLDAWLANNR